MIHKQFQTDLLPVYSLQTNMVCCEINLLNKKELFVLLNTGITLSIWTEKEESTREIYNTLHFYPVSKPRENNSKQLTFKYILKEAEL